MNKPLIYGLVAIALGCVAWITYNNIEFYDENIDSGWSSQANINDYLVLQRYLELNNTQVEAIPHLPTEKNLYLSDFILVPNSNSLQLSSQKKQIMDWVSNGGHLLIGAGYGLSPPIVSDLGFSIIDPPIDENEADELENTDGDDEAEKTLAQRLIEKNEAINKRNESSDAPIIEPEDDLKIVCNNLLGLCGMPAERELNQDMMTIIIKGDEQLSLNIGQWAYINHLSFNDGTHDIEHDKYDARIENKFGNKQGLNYVKVSLGSGFVYIFSSTYFLENSNIGHFDHAYFFDHQVGDIDNALILYGNAMPSLGVLVYRYFFEALIAVFFVIMVGLFYFSSRLGLKSNIESTTRRSRLERYSAIGQYRWRQANDESLLSPLRDDIAKLASNKWPAFTKSPLTDQVNMLALHSKLPPEQINLALNDTLRFSESSFTNTIKILQFLRNSL